MHRWGPGGEDAVRASPKGCLDLAADNLPIGQYPRLCRNRMQESPEYGKPFVDRMKANAVSEETNVKLVLGKLQTGEADAGLVYVSDALNQEVPAINPPPGYRSGRPLSGGSGSAARPEEEPDQTG